MEKSMEGSRELQCVGKLEIARPKPVGFLCGSIPVPTDKAFHSFNCSDLIPSSRQTVSAPRYRMLPTETDLNSPPLLSTFPEKVLPIGAVQSRPGGDLSWDVGTVSSNLTRKCEALAVSGLVEYGDEIDVIAPADILKLIFKIPYSMARLSIAVQRIGQTLVLNAGPDIEEGEKIIRRHNNQTKSADQSLFLNFAMHSVRMEACDCPPAHHVPSHEQSNSSVLPGVNTQFVGQPDDVMQHEGSNHSPGYAKLKHDDLFWGNKKNKIKKGHAPVKKVSQVGEKPRTTMQDSEKQKRVSDDGFLRVLFWQFHNFRMLLGSDLLLFSNEKYVAVSLHLWDVTREITPLTWLEAWLDNVMASVPELAICYHQNGVVQGYELLKTDDIFLLKGISDDGTPAFHPYVVQQNGLSVLRFLQENCKQEPGAYWLHKSSGEDVIQLFDLSVIPKTHSSSDCDDCSTSLPSIVHKGRSDSLYSLGTLLYRIAHRLSLSMAPDNRTKCAKFIKKCLEFLEEPDHLVVRAFAHEQFARLILNHCEDLEMTSEAFPVECEITVSDAEDSYFLSNVSDVSKQVSSVVVEEQTLFEDREGFQDLARDASIKMTLEANASCPRASGNMETGDSRNVMPPSCADESFMLCDLSPGTTHVVQTVADPISSKLAAIHHVSQAIKSLRWMRQLQNAESELKDRDSETRNTLPPSRKLSICACGDADCIEVCDIKEWLPRSKLDHKLWKLVLLLGESYLALGHAYKEDGQLHQALKVVELACSVYGSMPQHLKESRFISSMIGCSLLQTKFNYKNDKTKKYNGDTDAKDVSSSSNDSLTSEQFSSSYLFWAKAWTLVGDIYVENYMVKGNEISIEAERKSSTTELKVSSEVVKEVKRLKKKLGQFMQNCSACSLVNCSCQSDRANSGSSASSRNGDMHSISYGRKQTKRSYAKSNTYSFFADHEDDNSSRKVENRQAADGGQLQHNRDARTVTDVFNTDNIVVKGVAATNSFKAEGALNMHDLGSSMGSQSDTASSEKLKGKSGGIFKYLQGPIVGDVQYHLSAALSCYKEARNAVTGLPSGSGELQSVVKKIGWVCNELGRYRLEKKELKKAEIAFADAIKAFREVSDHTNIILINCNLGHGRRSLAEAMVSRINDLEVHGIFHNAYNHALETAKLEYSESLRFYGAAKSELNTMEGEDGAMSSSLRTEVYTQFANTHLRLGMLLAKKDIRAEVYGSGVMEEEHLYFSSPSGRRTRKEVQKHEISANDAIREALYIYESLGELRKQEAAYAYFQLACYQRDCCLKFLESGHKKSNFGKAESNHLVRVKQYASLAERNWQKAMDFYGPETHFTMYLTILMERSAFLSSLSNTLHSNAMSESALSHMFEGRNISKTSFDLLKVDYPELHSKFWSQLQMLLRKMLAAALSGGGNKPSASQPTPSSCISGDAVKLRELYGNSLKSSDFNQLNAMYSLWIS
ncbi:Tetratricopeptide-like helical domain containing protein [Parasponia andersonii]|uniref:Tetratricopeptide-like helical domain containing protein n=1 Tax=Parasponia andersonii TaxID=3476 RepID=A0A2P5E1V8_PARAD|nr:Tetratricopeptide-like helical domain containing protein [Parasponia andersonii]